MIPTKFDHDLGLRHVEGMTAEHFIRRYCEVFRPRELLGLPNDPRDSIEEIEDAMQDVVAAKTRLAAVLYAARGDLPDYSDAALATEVGE